MTEPPAGIDNHWKESSYPKNIERRWINSTGYTDQSSSVHCLKAVIKNIKNLMWLYQDYK